MSNLRRALKLLVGACVLLQAFLSKLTVQNSGIPSGGNPPEAWGYVAKARCSMSKGSVPVETDSSHGFDISQGECKSKCLNNTDCHMYSHGRWTRGLSPPFGYHGKLRCQLYRKCERETQAGVTVWYKPLPPERSTGVTWHGQSHSMILLCLAQTTVHVIAVACSDWSGVCCGLAAMLLAMEVEIASNIKSSAPQLALHAVAALLLFMMNRCTKAVDHGDVKVNGRMARLPSWRRNECQPPAWMSWALFMFSWPQMLVLEHVGNVMPCAVGTRASPDWLRMFGVSGSGVGVCPSRTWQAVAVFVFGLACTWTVALLAVMLSNGQGTCCVVAEIVGLAALASRLCLSLGGPWPEGVCRLALTVVTHGVCLLLLREMRMWIREKVEELHDAEASRPERERQLVKLLFDYVEPHCQELSAHDDWSTCVDICLYGGAIFAVSLVAAKVDSHVFVSMWWSRPLANLLGLDVSSVLRYGLLATAISCSSPILVHTFLAIRRALQQLRLGAARGHAFKLRWAAVKTAEWVHSKEVALGALYSHSPKTPLGDENPHMPDRNTTKLERIAHSLRDRFPEEELMRRAVDEQGLQLMHRRLGEASGQLHFSEDEMGGLRDQADSLEQAARASATQVLEIQGSVLRALLGTKWLWRGLALCLIVGAIWALVWWDAQSAAIGAHVSAHVSPNVTAEKPHRDCGDSARLGGMLTIGAAALFAIPGVGPAGLAAVELAAAIGIGAGGGAVDYFHNCILAR